MYCEVSMRRRTMAYCLFCVMLFCFCAPAQTTTVGLDAPQLFKKGMNSLVGSGTSRSELDAVEYFRRSADLGYFPAQVATGYFSEVRSAPSEAVDWYKKAAQQDDALAEWLVGRMYFTGTGAGRDLSEASRWLEKASGHDDAFGHYLLGMVRLERSDFAGAAGLFRKAAMQGFPQAQRQLALLLKEGRGTQQDKFEAYVWLLVSVSGRNSDPLLQELETALGTTQMEAAKGQARELEQTANRGVTSRGCTGWVGEFAEIPATPPPDIQRFCH